MSAPSSSPRGEHSVTPGAGWDTVLRRVEVVVDDEAPEPKPNRKTRRAVRRAAGRRR